MNVLVTGASGFLGSWVVDALVETGHNVIATRFSRTDGPDAAGVRWETLDIRDPARILTVLDSDDIPAVVHCAAYGVDCRQQDLLTAVDINVRGTAVLALAAAEVGVRTFLHVGTGYEYGPHPDDLTETSPLRPLGIYGATKAAAVQVLREIGRRWEHAPIVVRPFGMYGPGEGDHKLIPQVVRAARLGEFLDLRAGLDIRDYQFVGDVARAIAELATLPKEQSPWGETFNLASGRPTTIRALVEEVAGALGATHLMRFGTLPSRSATPTRVVGSPARFRAFCAQIGRTDLLVQTSMLDVIAQFAPQKAEE